MAFKVLAFLTKRAGVSRAELVEHYEKRHVPLVLSLAPPPASYCRNYPVDGDETSPGRPDVSTDLTFADRPGYESWVAVLYAPGSGVAAGTGLTPPSPRAARSGPRPA